MFGGALSSLGFVGGFVSDFLEDKKVQDVVNTRVNTELLEYVNSQDGLNWEILNEVERRCDELETKFDADIASIRFRLDNELSELPYTQEIGGEECKMDCVVP